MESFITIFLSSFFLTGAPPTLATVASYLEVAGNFLGASISLILHQSSWSFELRRPRDGTESCTARPVSSLQVAGP